MTTVINTRPKVTGVIYWAIGILSSINKLEKNCATVKTTIPLGAISATTARSFLVISVPNVARSTEIGLTNTIITKLKSMSCQDNTLSNTSLVREDVIKINTVLTSIDDALSIKWSDSLKMRSWRFLRAIIKPKIVTASKPDSDNISSQILNVKRINTNWMGGIKLWGILSWPISQLNRKAAPKPIKIAAKSFKIKRIITTKPIPSSKIWNT